MTTAAKPCHICSAIAQEIADIRCVGTEHIYPDVYRACHPDAGRTILMERDPYGTTVYH